MFTKTEIIFIKAFVACQFAFVNMSEIESTKKLSTLNRHLLKKKALTI